MPFTKFVEVGRVVFIAFGPNQGKIATIVDVIDQNRALIEGPNVDRQSCNFKRMHLTKFRLKFQHSSSSHLVLQAWKDAKMSQKWHETAWAKKLKDKRTKEAMTDFDRFKLMKAKQARNKAIKWEFSILKRKAKKLAPKPKPKVAKKPVPKTLKKEAKPKGAKPVGKKAEGKAPAGKKPEGKAAPKKAEGKAAAPKAAAPKKAEAKVAAKK